MKRLINIFFSAVFLLNALSSFAQVTAKTPEQLPTVTPRDSLRMYLFNKVDTVGKAPLSALAAYMKTKMDPLYAPIGVVAGSGPYLDARALGIPTDGVSNCRPRLQAILDSLKVAVPHNRVPTIFFPNGDYKFWNTTAATDWYLNARIYIKAPVALVGESKTGTRFIFRGTGNTDPQTNWDIYNSPEFGNVAIRSPGILVRAETNTDTLRGIQVRNMTLDGGIYAPSYDNNYPTTASLPNRWDLSHKGIMFYGDSGTNSDDTHIENVSFTGWLGEEIWTGLGVQKLFIEYCTFRRCNASALSCGGSLTIRYNQFDSVTNAMECYTGKGTSIVEGNRIFNIWEASGKANGIVWGGATSLIYDDMEAIISNNEIWNCQKAGIILLRENREVTIANNRIHDCYHLIRLEPFDSPMEGIHIFGNTLTSKYWIVNAAVAYLGGAPAFSVDNVDIHGNYIYETDTARNANIGISYGFLHYQTKGNRFAFHDNVIDIKGYGQSDATGGSGTVTFPVVYRNEYVRGVLLSDGHYTLGSTLTILPMEAQGLFNYDDGAGNVNIDFDTRGADGTEATVYKNDALTHYVFQLSNAHFKLKADFALTAQNDWVRFKKRNGKWEVIATNTQF